MLDALKSGKYAKIEKNPKGGSLQITRVKQ